MSTRGIALIVVTLAAVVAWYTSLAMGVVHSVYVFAPN
jgi:energy-coupling factor transport system permease protein